MKYWFCTALAAMVVVSSGVAGAQSTGASSSDAILQRLDALDKRNAKLEQDNATLRERLRLIEERQPRAAAATVRSPTSTRDRPPEAAMAMAQPGAALAYKASIPSAAPYRWTGFYVGGHVGGGLAQNKWNSLTPFDPLNAPTFVDTIPQQMGSHNAPGLLGGFQAGYNWQFTHWILGVEGQYSFANLKGDHQNTLTSAATNDLGGGTSIATTLTQVTGLSTRIDAIGTIAGRIGYTSDAFDRTMFYLKGGAAYVRDSYSENTQTNVLVCFSAPGNSNCAAGGFTGTFSGKQDRWGWLGGVGLEYGISENWSANIEYDFLGFGTGNVNMPGTFCLTGTANCRPLPNQTFAVDQNMQLLKFGVNYHFH